LVLYDFDDESINFAKVFLEWKKPNQWQKYVTLVNYDMNRSNTIGGCDCYIFQDSIEHTNNPTEYLNKAVREAKVGSFFIFSIPIEVDKAIPEHTIFWKSVDDAINWLSNAGLEIIEHEEILMNPSLDLFAKFLHKEFKELVVLSRKG
jgi:hypothetical protein